MGRATALFGYALLTFSATFPLATLVPADASGQSYRPVTDERLESPEPENWLSYRGNYSGWGYSELDQIDVSNVEGLVPVWTFSTGTDSLATFTRSSCRVTEASCSPMLPS